MATTKSGNELLKEQTGLVAKDTKPTFAQMLEKMKPEFEKVLPNSLNPQRLIRIVLTEVRKNPALAECDPHSVIGAVMIGAQLGLEPGVMGQSYLIPYKKTCTFVPGWKGYVDLVSRSGRAFVETRAVYEGEEFSVDYGCNDPIHHIPNIDIDPYTAKLRAVYAKGWIKGMDRPIVEVWGVAKVLSHLKRYNKVGERHYAKANDHNFEMYARKLPLLQVIKYLPKSVELQIASSLDYAADAGVQNLTISSVKDQAWDIPAESEPADLGEKAKPIEESKKASLGPENPQEGEYIPSDDELFGDGFDVK